MSDHIAAITALRERWKYMEAQVMLGQPRDLVQAKQVVAIDMLAKRSSCSLEGVTAVCDEMRAPSYGLTDEDKKTLLAILAHSEENSTCKRYGATARKCQEMEFPEYSITATDCEYLKDEDVNPKAVRVGTRLAEMGVTCPSATLL